MYLLQSGMFYVCITEIHLKVWCCIAHLIYAFNDIFCWNQDHHTHFVPWLLIDFGMKYMAHFELFHSGFMHCVCFCCFAPLLEHMIEDCAVKHDQDSLSESWCQCKENLLWYCHQPLHSKQPGDHSQDSVHWD